MDNPHSGTQADGNGFSPLKSAILLGLGIAILILAAIVMLRPRAETAPTVSETAPAAAAPAFPVPVAPPLSAAEEAVRRRLDELEPPFRINEPVQLRRQNGIVDQGILTGFAGAGTDRVAVVATPTGQIGIPLAVLDEPSRRRLDAEFRENYIRHQVDVQPSAGE